MTLLSSLYNHSDTSGFHHAQYDLGHASFQPLESDQSSSTDLLGTHWQDLAQDLLDWDGWDDLFPWWPSEPNPKPEPEPAESFISSVGAGNHFSVFLDQATNTLYSTGENIVNQLGNGTTGFDVKTPQPVEMPEGFDATITKISSGLLHTSILTETGDVYSFGFNNRGMLGVGDEEEYTSAVKVEALDDVHITDIEAGNGYGFAISDTGALYGWGSNTNGQLGLGDRESRLEPTVIEALEGQPVTSISAGISHTLVLTKSGAVYAMGSNTDGQLGSPEALEDDGSPMRRYDTPVLVEGLPDNIVSVSADAKTSYAVTADGKVYGWGESRNGQLQNGQDQGDGTFIVDESDVLEPQLLTHMPEGVVEVSGGARWGVAITDKGEVWVWGPNDQGPSGGLDGDPEAESDASFYPTKIEQLDGVNIVDIETGPNSILAIADNGEVYGWGSNSDGRLGFASEGAIYEPTLIEVRGEAAPWLVSATPADNDRDVSNDAALTLNFTETVEAGEGYITLHNRDSGEAIQIDIQDERLVEFDGEQILVTPPRHLDADARYHVSIDEGAIVDTSGVAYAGIDEDDRFTFNFSTDEQASDDSDTGWGGFGHDLLRGGTGDDWYKGFFGDDMLSGGDGEDRLEGGFGNDILYGDAGDDLLKGGFGDDVLYGGTGDDWLLGGFGDDTLNLGEGSNAARGGFGQDTFVIESSEGMNQIQDFAGHDTLDLSALDLGTVEEAMRYAIENNGNVLFDFGAQQLQLDDTSLQTVEHNLVV